MRPTSKEHWCLRCYGPFKGYKCRSIRRAREKRAWKKREQQA